MTSTIATNTTNNTIILQSVDMLLNSTRRYTNCYRKNFSCDLRILYYKFKNFGNSRINIFLTTFLTTLIRVASSELIYTSSTPSTLNYRSFLNCTLRALKTVICYLAPNSLIEKVPNFRCCT